MEWEANSNSSSIFNKTASILDINSNLIVVGNKLNSSGNSDVLISKYNSEGALQWQKTFDGVDNENDYGVSVKVDNSNNIYVAAAINTTTTESDIGLLKYNAAGVLQYDKTWTGNFGIDVPSDLISDNAGNVFIAGSTEASNGQSDYTIIKYSNGIQQWQTSYDYNNLHDAAVKIEFSSSNVLVTGASASTVTNWDYTTLLINSSTGGISNTQRTSLAGAGLDQVTDATTDNNDNLYLTGYVELNGIYNIRTVKIDTSFNIAWVVDHTNGYNEKANAICVDDMGNVYITGSKENTPTQTDFLTIKYNSSGVLIWERSFGSNAMLNTFGADKILIDNNYNVIIGGTTVKNNNSDFAVIGYSYSGNILFSEYYDNNGSSEQIKDLVINDNSYYLTGTSTNGSITSIAIAKYERFEKNINFEVDSSGNALYEKNDALVKFDDSYINTSTIDNKHINVGPPSKFLNQTACTELELVLNSINCDIKDVLVYKIFPFQSTTMKTTTSRRGNEISIPNFWSNLLLEFPNSVNVVDAINAIKTTNCVQYAELNLAFSLLSIPNDTAYIDYQPNLHPTALYPDAHINIEPAWDYSTGKPNVKVGIIDSGTNWTHTDFDNPEYPYYSKIKGWDFFTQMQMTSITIGGDMENHGTRVAGIIGANRNNDYGVAGIAGGSDLSNPLTLDVDSLGVSLYSMKIFELLAYSSNPFNDIANAIVGSAIDDTLEYTYGVNIQNHSWGIHAHSQNNGTFFLNDTNISLLTEASHFANRAEVTFIAGRGNFGAYQMIDTLFPNYPDEVYPAVIDDDWILCVGGTGQDGQYRGQDDPGDFYASSIGYEIDVAAPAHSDIVTTTSAFNGGVTDLASFGGASAATAHVSGLAALLMSYINKPIPHYDNLAPEDIEYILQATADDCDSAADPILIGFDSLTGHGRINAGNAFTYIDTNLHKLAHYDTDVFSTVSTQTLISTNDTIQLSEHYTNENNIFFNMNSTYLIDTYKVEKICSHNIPFSNTIKAYWPRPSDSDVFELYDSTNNILRPRQRLSIDAINKTNATLTGYVYEVKDLSGGSLGWIPHDLATQVDTLKMAYSILYTYNEALKVDNLENNDNFNVHVYPNPFAAQQNMSITVNQPSACSIRLLGSNGKLVKVLIENESIDGEIVYSFDLSSISNGVYYYQVQLNEEIQLYKIIKND